MFCFFVGFVWVVGEEVVLFCLAIVFLEKDTGILDINLGVIPLGLVSLSWICLFRLSSVDNVLHEICLMDGFQARELVPTYHPEKIS